MKPFLFTVFVFGGLALCLGEVLLYAAVPAEDSQLLPYWLPLASAFVLFLVAFAGVGCLELRAHIKEALGWIVLMLLCCLAGYIGYTHLPTQRLAVVEMVIFALYTIFGLVGATLALRNRAA